MLLARAVGLPNVAEGVDELRPPRVLHRLLDVGDGGDGLDGGADDDAALLQQADRLVVVLDVDGAGLGEVPAAEDGLVGLVEEVDGRRPDGVGFEGLEEGGDRDVVDVLVLLPARVLDYGVGGAVARDLDDAGHEALLDADDGLPGEVHPVGLVGGLAAVGDLGDDGGDVRRVLAGVGGRLFVAVGLGLALGEDLGRRVPIGRLALVEGVAVGEEPLHALPVPLVGEVLEEAADGAFPLGDLHQREAGAEGREVGGLPRLDDAVVADGRHVRTNCVQVGHGVPAPGFVLEASDAEFQFTVYRADRYCIRRVRMVEVSLTVNL